MINWIRHLSKTTRIMVAALIVLALAAGLFLSMRDTQPSSSISDSSPTLPPSQPSQTPQPTPSGTPQSFSGKIVCLPKPGNGPQTLECAIGIQTAAGENYALKNNPMYDLPIDTEVTVTGILAPASDSEIYDIAGTIEVQNIEKAE